MLAQTEEWRVIPDFPRYECSSFGRFRNRSTGKYLCGTTVHNGYLHIGLIRNGKQITKLSHRVIAETFLEKPSPRHTDVNHKDKVRTNNRISNLEWSTRSHNSRHAKSKNTLSQFVSAPSTPGGLTGISGQPQTWLPARNPA